jgi:hypothetical protein
MKLKQKNTVDRRYCAQWFQLPHKKEILGMPPVLVFCGHHADIDSSSTIHVDGCTKFCHC